MLDLFRTLPGLLHDVEGAEVVREAIVFAAWRRVAGDALAEHAVPVALESGRLKVAVSNLTWQRHLKDLLGQMMFRMNASLGEPLVNYIDLQIDDEAVQSHRMKGRTQDLDLTGAEKEITPELSTAANGIEDDELRRLFLLAAGNCLARRKVRRSETPAG